MRALLLWLAAVPALAQPGLYRFSVDQDKLAGAPDFSFLNHALGPADRLSVRDGHFVRAGGGRVRLFGVNLAFGANFPEAADAPRIARRLRRLGVNLVRLHHMDSSPDRDPATAGSTLTTGPYPSLNPVAIARLRRLLDALSAEGIYVNLNLHVGYVFRPEVDRVPALPDQQPMPFQSKPLHIFYPRMVELQTEYTRKLIAALGLKNHPVLAMIEIDNETSLLEAWQRGNLERYALGEYKAELDRQWKTFERAHPGADYLLFLADRDRHYLGEMLGAIRQSTEGQVPVAGTQMGYGGLLNLDSHAGLDFQDNHFYIDHYNFPHVRWDPRDWRIRDSSSVGSGMATFLNMAAARQSTRPYTVSEFNQPWPNRQAAETDPTLAAFGAFQDWDAIVHFAYSHNRNWDNQVPSGFDINGDWTKFPNIGQSAWLFRSGAIQAGAAPVEIPVSGAMALEFGRQKRVGNIAPFLQESAGYDPALAFVHPVALRKQEAGRASYPPLKPPYRSDTGELTYDPARRLYRIEAPQAAGVFGFVGAGNKAQAGAMSLELAASARGFVTVLLTALDGRPLADSARMLLSIPGYTLGSRTGGAPQKLVPYESAADWWTIESDPAFSEKPSGNRNGGLPPVWMERVESIITLRSRATSLRVYPLDGAGARLEALGGIERTDGGFRIYLQAEGQVLAPWYELAAER